MRCVSRFLHNRSVLPEIWYQCAEGKEGSIKQASGWQLQQLLTAYSRLVEQLYDYIGFEDCFESILLVKRWPSDFQQIEPAWSVVGNWNLRTNLWHHQILMLSKPSSSKGHTVASGSLWHLIIRHKNEVLECRKIRLVDVEWYNLTKTKTWCQWVS